MSSWRCGVCFTQSDEEEEEEEEEVEERIIIRLAHPTAARRRLKPETKAKDISIFSYNFVQRLASPRLIVFLLVIYYFPTATAAIFIHSSVHPFLLLLRLLSTNQQFRVISIAPAAADSPQFPLPPPPPPPPLQLLIQVVRVKGGI